MSKVATLGVALVGVEPRTFELRGKLELFPLSHGDQAKYGGQKCRCTLIHTFDISRQVNLIDDTAAKKSQCTMVAPWVAQACTSQHTTARIYI